MRSEHSRCNCFWRHLYRHPQVCTVPFLELFKLTHREYYVSQNRGIKVRKQLSVTPHLPHRSLQWLLVSQGELNALLCLLDQPCWPVTLHLALITFDSNSVMLQYGIREAGWWEFGVNRLRSQLLGSGELYQWVQMFNFHNTYQITMPLTSKARVHFPLT